MLKIVMPNYVMYTQNKKINLLLTAELKVLKISKDTDATTFLRKLLP